MSNKIIKNCIVGEKSKNKINNLLIKIIFFILLIIVICFSFYKFYIIGLNKNGKTITEKEYNTINLSYDKEKIKYNKILEYNSIKDIYDYFMLGIENYEYYPIPIMDYVIEKTFKNATEYEKYSLFYMYYLNLSGLETEYTTYLNDSSNQQFFNNNYNAYDFSSLKDIDNISKDVLRNIFVNMKINNLEINENFPEIIVHYNYNNFIDKFGDILDSDYSKFIDLERQSDEMIVNPGGTSYNSLVSIWYLHNYEDFIKNTKNQYLKSSAQDIYEQNLALFFAQYDSSSFYSNESNCTVSTSYSAAYETYLELYPNDKTSELCNNVMSLIYQYNGTGTDIVDNINSLIYSYIEDSEWLPNKTSEDGLNMDKSVVNIQK